MCACVYVKWNKIHNEIHTYILYIQNWMSKSKHLLASKFEHTQTTYTFLSPSFSCQYIWKWKQQQKKLGLKTLQSSKRCFCCGIYITYMLSTFKMTLVFYGAARTHQKIYSSSYCDYCCRCTRCHRHVQCMLIRWNVVFVGFFFVDF